MVSLVEFKELCKSVNPDEIVEEVLLSFDAMHVSQENITLIQSELSKAYSVPADRIFIWIVGSAKLGFSISETGEKKRYRSYGADSDIDVAVVSPCIYRSIWNELSAHAHNQPLWPWKAKKLGDYHVAGWLRPDHFPRTPWVMKCNAWKDTFSKLSKDPRFSRRQVSGGLFYSLNDLRRYLRRAVNQCVAIER